jgi:hypothetical protein
MIFPFVFFDAYSGLDKSPLVVSQPRKRRSAHPFSWNLFIRQQAYRVHL